MDLTSETKDRLLGFLGYGNPAGRLWVMGMEEGTAGLADLHHNLEQRLRFEETMDLAVAHSEQYLNDPITPTRNRFPAVWRNAARIALALEGNADWKSNEAAKRFVRGRLGRHDDTTFLPELMPLPRSGVGVWPEPYSTWFPTAGDYLRQVRPQRISRFRYLLDEFRPACVVAYGRSNHGFYKELFGPLDWNSLPTVQAEGAVAGDRRIMLTPFLGNGQISVAQLEPVVEFLRERSS